MTEKKYKAKPATPSEIVRRFREVRKFTRLAEQAEERVGANKTWLKDQLQQVGIEDDKGSRFFALPEEIDGFRALKAEKRVRQSLNSNMATSILTKKKLLKKCQRTITVLDEDAILALIFKGVLSKDDEQAMYDESVSWALVPQKKAIHDAAGD